MKRPSSTTRLITAACLGAALALPAQAQFAKAEDAIKYRKAAFTLLGAHFGRVAAMAKGSVAFDAKAATDSITVALSVSKLPYTAFVAGSDKGDTRADPKVWSEADKFAELAAQMQDELGKLLVATKSGSFDAVKTAVGETGKSCKSCHDTYRRE